MRFHKIFLCGKGRMLRLSPDRSPDEICLQYDFQLLSMRDLIDVAEAPPFAKRLAPLCNLIVVRPLHSPIGCLVAFTKKAKESTLARAAALCETMQALVRRRLLRISRPRPSYLARIPFARNTP